MSSFPQYRPVFLGDEAPDFVADSTMGEIQFHTWLNESWCVFFSHPKDYTPVCTTELGRAAQLKSEFDRRNVKLLGLSVDSCETHRGWIKDINETQNVTMNFPIVGDEDGKIAVLYGMLQPNVSYTHTVRSVFIIDPSRIVRLTMTYPESMGRNFDEIIRAIDSLQLTTYYELSTPADWKVGDDCVISPKITDPEELRRKYPRGWKEMKPYLRLTPYPREGQG